MGNLSVPTDIPTPATDLDNVGLLTHKLEFLGKAYQHLLETQTELFNRLAPVLAPDFPTGDSPTGDKENLEGVPEKHNSNIIVALDGLTGDMYKTAHEITHLMNRLEV